MIDESKIAERFAGLGPELNERQRRLWAASEARACGRGGIAAVARVTGISEDTVGRGIKELVAGVRLEPGQVRRRGAGRRALTVSDPSLLGDLERLVDPVMRGDPGSSLRWSSKSLGKLAGALVAAGHEVSDRSVGKLLRGLGFRLHANQKTREGKDHADRDAQFRHIDETVAAALEAGAPTISVDTKKRALVGDSRLSAVSTSRRAGRSRSVPTTSRTRISGTRSRTACLTSMPMRGWCRLVSRTTRARSRSTRSARGGSTLVLSAIPRRRR